MHFAKQQNRRTNKVATNLEVQALAELTPLIVTFQKTGEEHARAGDELGSALIRWRDAYKAQGQAGAGFKALLARLDIPRATAYRLMDRVGGNLVSDETKQEFAELRLTVTSLERWARKLPDSLKDCPGETVARLRDVQAKVTRVLDGIEADAAHIRRVESSHSLRRIKASSRPQVDRALRDLERGGYRRTADTVPAVNPALERLLQREAEEAQSRIH